MLTFKRGTHEELNHIDITKDMIYFTTDNNGDNSIYFDSDNTRYKIFGLNDTDIISINEEPSINKYYNISSHDFLTYNDIATNGDTTNKKAIGIGYYNNIIGSNYSTYFNNTITANIAYLKSQGRSSLSELWTNNDLEHYWSEDLNTSQLSVTESKDINITTAYLGYILLVKSYLTDSCTYAMITFGLPTSVSNNTPIIHKEEWEYVVADGYNTSAINSRRVRTSLTLTLSGNNYKTFTISKYGNLLNNNASVDFHNYLIPIALYGWGI